MKKKKRERECLLHSYVFLETATINYMYAP